jgi:hypothetical protein
MRMRRVSVVLLVLAALSCLPESAGAAAGPSPPPARQWLDIDLEGSDGYSIHLSVNPRQHLILQLSKGEFTAEYMTRDLDADADRAKAKLRGLGTIAVRFRPRGRVRHPSLPECGEGRPTVQPGIVRGTIRFVGEREYTRVAAHEAEAAIEDPVRWDCRFGSRSEWDPRRLDWISKLSANVEGVYFLARRYRPGVVEGGRVLYLAETGEAFRTKSGRPPLTIWRRVKVPAPLSTFRDAHPERLVAAPPPPFSGTAAIARTPESVFTWDGDLSVQFPVSTRSVWLVPASSSTTACGKWAAFARTSTSAPYLLAVAVALV